MINRISNRYYKMITKKRKFVQGLNGGQKNLHLRALLYYKTNPIRDFDLVKNYKHPNNWRITELVRILNLFGFVVDIVDRSLDNFKPEDNYDLFIGLGSCNSGKYYGKYGAILSKAVKILYCTEPSPEYSVPLYKERYDDFFCRTGVQAPYMRVHDKVNFSEFLKHTDYILAIGEPGVFCYDTYLGYGKPVLPFLPNTKPDLVFDSSWLATRRKNKFLSFSGHGLIGKGVDLLIEVFKDMPEMDLVVCGPKEEAFTEAYQEELSGNKNIEFKGFGTGSVKWDAQVRRPWEPSRVLSRKAPCEQFLSQRPEFLL